LFAHVRPPTELRLFRCTNAHTQERLASARRESGTALAGECDSRRWTNHVKSGGREAAVSRQRACKGSRKSRAIAASCSVKSGGCQPAVARETHLQERFRKVAGDCRRWLTNVSAITFVKPRGAYTPRSCSRACARRRNCDFSDVQTHIHKSGGRQPAVSREPHWQGRFRNSRGDCRWCAGVRHCMCRRTPVLFGDRSHDPARVRPTGS